MKKTLYTLQQKGSKVNSVAQKKNGAFSCSVSHLDRAQYGLLSKNQSSISSTWNVTEDGEIHPCPGKPAACPGNCLIAFTRINVTSGAFPCSA